MTPLRPAGPDRRFSAFALDRALVWTVDGLVVALVWWWLGRSHPAVAVFLAVVVAALLWLVLGVVAGLTGRSPGKALLGLRLVRADDGGPLGVGRALLRALVLTLATLPTFGIGAAVLAWTATADATGRRRGWHDLVTGSVVVDLRPVAAPATPVAAPPPPIVNLTTLRLMPVESAVEERLSDRRGTVRRLAEGHQAPATAGIAFREERTIGRLARPVIEQTTERRGVRGERRLRAQDRRAVGRALDGHVGGAEFNGRGGGGGAVGHAVRVSPPS